MNTAIEIKHYDLLSGGMITSAVENKYFEAINPSTGEVFARVADASIDDMRNAIKSARQAFDQGMWRPMSFPERGIYLKRTAKLIRKYAKELAELETLDCGKIIKQSTFIDVPTAADSFDYFSNISDELKAKTNKVPQPVESITEFEPRGVIGAIIPWNYPMIMTAWKLAPILMAGNTVVLKPSPLGCVSVMRLAQILVEAGFPQGVVNVVSSQSAEVSQVLAQSVDVDMISFTGGTQTGKHIMKAAADTLKKVTLELGGKSPTIVFADCNMDAAVGGVMTSIFMNQGQMCTAGSRLLIEAAIYDDFLRCIIEKTKSLKIGNASDTTNAFGPLISVEHRDCVLKMIEQAIKDGAKLECGGKIPDGLDKGAFLEPTILSNVTNSMAIAQEEVFGPVLSVMKFLNFPSAGKIANAIKYGLAASIWTKDLDKAKDLARTLQCGTVWINTYGIFCNEVAFGGYKQSGFGRELGSEGMLEYMQSKHICIDKTLGGKSLVAWWF